MVRLRQDRRGVPTRPGCRRGQATVEFAFVGILLLLFVMAVFEGARMVITYVALANAAREGARAGMYVPGTSGVPSVTTLDNNIRTQVNGTTAWITGTIPNSDIVICRRRTATSACDAAGTSTVESGSTIEVTVNYTFRFLPFQFVTGATGLAARSTIPMSGFDRMRIE